jgi:hypothetical protein
VVIADLSNVADLFDLDLAGYDEGSGRITNFHDAGRSADAMTLLLAERTTVEGRIDVAARRALAAAASLGPGIGEVQDLLLLIDPRALFDDRVMAGVSLLASAVTVGGAPNFAAVRTAGGATRALPAARRIEAAWSASTYRHGGLMTGMEHIIYRHSASSGFANVSRYARGTTARNIVGYVDEALRYGTVTPDGAGYIVEHSLGRVIGTNIAGDAASSIRVFVRDGVIQTAFPF